MKLHPLIITLAVATLLTIPQLSSSNNPLLSIVHLLT